MKTGRHVERALTSPDIRRLRGHDKDAVAAHFGRLDPATRRARFGTAVSAAFVADYAEHVLATESIVYGAFVKDLLRGLGELRVLSGHWPRRAEIALSVEPDWQHAGIGDALFSCMVTAAQNRGIGTLFMQCLADNAQMQRLARRHDAILSFDLGEVAATLDPPWPTPLSLAEEMMGETRRYLRAVLQPKA